MAKQISSGAMTRKRESSSTGGAGTPSRRLVLFACGLVLTIALHVWLSNSAPLYQRPASDQESFSRTAKLGKPLLQPYKAVSRTFLTAASEADSWSVGACRTHAPLLPMPAIMCEPLYCLRSPKYPSEFVDVWFKAMTTSNDSVMLQSCSDAVGGQVGRQTKAIQVSFIVTFKDNVQMTMQCLLELFRTAREADSVEFVVVDDGSVVDTSDLIEFGRRINLFFGVPFTVLRNAKPQGYGAANTMGVHKAVGKYIVLLNNDAFVTPGWLHALLRTLETVPKVGITGPLFVSSKGTIMEAGGAIFANGNAANYGRSEQPDHRHMYSRQVDYISAACIMMPRSVFIEANGFNPIYQRGYYEDTDLAMAVTHMGYRVQYQPLAVVVHNEGGSLSAEKEVLMLTNQAIFAHKWHTELETTHCSSNLPLDTAAMRMAGSKRILWIDDIVPEPDKDSGSIRTNNILTLLRDMEFSISYQATAQRSEKYTAQARFNGIQVLPVRHPREWTLQRSGQCLYDVIFIARLYVYEQVAAVVQDACRFTPIVYDTVDLHFLREARMALSSNRRWNFHSTDLSHVAAWLDSTDHTAKLVARTRDRELSLIKSSRVTVVVSDEETKLLEQMAPGATIKVISNVHVVDQYDHPPQDCSSRQGILFVGNFNHMPNQQALQALVEDVLPELYKWIPVGQKQSLILHIVGSNRTPTINMHDSQITTVYHGWLSDQQLRLLYSTVKVVVAPLMSGAGVKGKINQAMLYGVPVVATPVAAEGMHLVDGVNALIASTPREFAHKLLDIYTDCSMWERIVRGGTANVRELYSMQAAAIALKEVLAEVQLLPIVTGSRCH